MLRGLQSQSDQPQWDVVIETSSGIAPAQSRHGESIDAVIDQHRLMSERRERSRVESATAEANDVSPGDKEQVLLVDLDTREEELARFRFRCASLSKQVRIGDDALADARNVTARAEAERARLHEELMQVRRELDQARVETTQKESELANLREAFRETNTKVDRSEGAPTGGNAERHRQGQWLHPKRRRIMFFPLSREKRAYRQIAASGLFDERWYLNEYADVEKCGLDPLVHFLRAGASEGRNPSSFFNTSLYCEANPDVVAAKINPLLHYVLHGQREGRAREPSVARLAVGASA